MCVVSTAFCMFLYNCQKLTFYQLGAYDHSVLYTTAQLTEGRSARDQPKQPPAKKTTQLAHDRGESLDQTCYRTSIPSAIQASLSPRVYGRVSLASKFPQGSRYTLDQAAVETLSSMVCGANYCAVSESMGQHSVSLKTWSDGCAVLAMDWLPWAHSCKSMAHKAGSIPTQTTTWREGWSDEGPVLHSIERFYTVGLIAVWQGIIMGTRYYFSGPEKEGDSHQDS